MTRQEEFEANYITSAELCERLGISKQMLLNGNKNGYLPEPVKVSGSQLFIWVRSETIELVNSWEKLILAKRDAKTSRAVSTQGA